MGNLRDNENLNELNNFILGDYLKLSRRMISIPRIIGRNAFHHNIASMCIAIDYRYTNPIILKSCLLHDFLEDVENASEDSIYNLDNDGPKVLKIVKELTKSKDESKLEYLQRLRNCSTEGKIVKLCDRIENLYSMLAPALEPSKISRILNQTEEYIIPIALEIDEDFYKEITDLLKTRRKYLEMYLIGK